MQTEIEHPSDIALLGKSYFDCREFERCAHSLRHAPADDHLAVFLRLYARYLSGEKKKDESVGAEGLITSKNSRVNGEVTAIIREYDELSRKSDKDVQDPFLLYILGVCLRLQFKEDEAIDALIRSVTLFPYNWSAWEELLLCFATYEKLTAVASRLPDHVVTRIFLVHADQSFYRRDEPPTAAALAQLAEVFPDFLFLKVQNALIKYHNSNYLEAEHLFMEIMDADPHRLDDMDAFSNVLYVMERAPKLAHLAQLANATDKFRPETCVIVGNYYSLKSEHEKAVSYYQRALVLNRSYLAAWTLIGHEFIELKNTHAAIESYRRAVDENRRDFRAWHGLGLAYEILDMHYYSLYYYQRAVALKPHDPRMWISLGTCFDKLDRTLEAVKAYKRALQVGDMDPMVLLSIGTLYDHEGDADNAAKYMSLCVAEETTEGPTEHTCHARLWLARYEMGRRDWSKAHTYAQGVVRGSPSEIEEARAIVRETKSRLNAGHAS